MGVYALAKVAAEQTAGDSSDTAPTQQGQLQQGTKKEANTRMWHEWSWQVPTTTSKRHCNVTHQASSGKTTRHVRVT